MSTQPSGSTLEGRAAAPGAAAAPAFRVAPPEPATYAVARSGDAAAERNRLTTALATAEAQLEELADRMADAVGKDEADIFEAHAMFAGDPQVARLAGDSIDAGASAEHAVTEAFATFRSRLAASSSEYLAARVADLDDVRDRVVAILQDRPVTPPVPTVASVVVAHDLTPSQTAGLPRDRIAGIVTATGSPTSHAAILARSLGIPAVVGCEGVLEVVEDGAVVAMDGRSGVVIVGADDDTIADFEERARGEEKRRAELTALRDLHGETADGHPVELAANIGGVADLPAALEAGAQGSGLVRTEFLFLDRRSAPTVDEQVEAYAEILRAFPGERVVFRTMDVGADKPLPFVVRDPEENPALGLRGIRLGLARPDLLRDQLAALLAARDAAGPGAGRLAIMFPLVSGLDEVRQARAALDAAAAADDRDLGDTEVGVMVEVPSAALSARRIADEVDFLSIGTNDLLQYLYAADRLQASVAALADACAPEFLALVADVVAAGHAGGCWVGVCGEAASDPATAVAFAGLGVDELSMTRVAIPEVKATLRGVTLDRARAVVDTAMDAADAAASRGVLESALPTG
jgi:phosphoenolpyruvate-protein phosphotransferase